MQAMNDSINEFVRSGRGVFMSAEAAIITGYSGYIGQEEVAGKMKEEWRRAEQRQKEKEADESKMKEAAAAAEATGKMRRKA